MNKNKDKKHWILFFVFSISFLFQISYSLGNFSNSYTFFNHKSTQVSKKEQQKEDSSSNIAVEEENENDDEAQNELIAFTGNYLPLYLTFIYEEKSEFQKFLKVCLYSEDIIITIRNLRI